MTKKDYIKLARLIKGSTENHYIPALVGGSLDILQAKPFVEELSDILQADNPKFDRERFIAACQ